MRKAKEVLKEILESPTCKKSRVSAFLHRVYDSTNDGATLNPSQENALINLIFENLRDKSASRMAKACGVAAWINSCR